jgi:hypothetical protein
MSKSGSSKRYGSNYYRRSNYSSHRSAGGRSKSRRNSSLPFYNRVVLVGRFSSRVSELRKAGWSYRGAVAKAKNEIPAIKKVLS